ncbi:hypothetical protein [Streptomyces sp. NPDC048442]|uniref:tetratricopeptide repeat protein n=1 Tax=Streptomyces sp. NPDC048442 TaxID=3154823 RepID=UPI00343FB809
MGSGERQDVSNGVSGQVGGSVVQARYVDSVHIGMPGNSLPDPMSWPLAREAPESAPTVKGGTDVLPYLPRDHDPALRELLRTHPFVLVTGPPLAGKTFSAWAAIREVGPGLRIYTPPKDTDFRTLPTALRQSPAGGRCVLWLDDLAERLGEGGLDHDVAGQLRHLGVPIVATMSDADYGAYRFGQDSHAQLLRNARVLRVAEGWSEAERTRLAESPNPRHRAVRDEKHVTKYLAVGSELWDEWQWAGDSGGHLRGHLLVRAALDVARCGYRGPVPLISLRETHWEYEEYESRKPELESAEEALAWATKVRHGVAGMLVAGEDERTWRVHGALLGCLPQPPDASDVAAMAWFVAARAAGEDDRAGILAAAREAFGKAVEAEDGTAMFDMGRLLEEHGDAEAADWFVLASDADEDNAAAAGSAGRALAAKGEYGRAVTYLERAVKTGDGDAAALLGKLHLDRARHWLAVAADGGDPESAHQLGRMLQGSDPDEALRRYRQAAEHDTYRNTVAASLGSLLHTAGQVDEAECWYRLGVQAGDTTAVHDLAVLLAGRDDSGSRAEAESLYLRAGKRGPHTHRHSVTHYGVLLVAQGQIVKGVDCLRVAADCGDSFAAYQLGRVLSRGGNSLQARQWFTKAAASGNLAAATALADLEKARADDAG